jgi:HSP20 family protein
MGMSTLSQLRDGLHRVWDSLAEGWEHLRNRAADALTRFNPPRNTGAVETAEDQAMWQGSRWGLLAADVEENDDDITVHLEVPGMQREDFDIEVEEDYLVVRGEKRAEREHKHGDYFMMECAYGQFERAILLPARVQGDSAKATYKRGVLTVTLQKDKLSRRRRIEVIRG